MENSMKILTFEEITEKHKRQAQQFLDEHPPKEGSEAPLEFWLINRGLRIIEQAEARYSDLLKKYEDLCRPEPSEAVVEPPRTRTRYQYFVSFNFNKEGYLTPGTGNTKFTTASRISDFKDIQEMEKLLKEQNNFSYVGIVCFIELDPIVEEVEGEG